MCNQEPSLWRVISVACSLKALVLWGPAQPLTDDKVTATRGRCKDGNTNVAGSRVTRVQQGVLSMGDNERVTAVSDSGLVIGTWGCGTSERETVTCCALTTVSGWYWDARGSVGESLNAPSGQCDVTEQQHKLQKDPGWGHHWKAGWCGGGDGPMTRDTCSPLSLRTSVQLSTSSGSPNPVDSLSSASREQMGRILEPKHWSTRLPRLLPSFCTSAGLFWGPRCLSPCPRETHLLGEAQTRAGPGKGAWEGVTEVSPEAGSSMTAPGSCHTRIPPITAALVDPGVPSLAHPPQGTPIQLLPDQTPF